MDQWVSRPVHITKDLVSPHSPAASESMDRDSVVGGEARHPITYGRSLHVTLGEISDPNPCYKPMDMVDTARKILSAYDASCKIRPPTEEPEQHTIEEPPGHGLTDYSRKEKPVPQVTSFAEFAQLSQHLFCGVPLKRTTRERLTPESDDIEQDAEEEMLNAAFSDMPMAGGLKGGSPNAIQPPTLTTPVVDREIKQVRKRCSTLSGHATLGQYLENPVYDRSMLSPPLNDEPSPRERFWTLKYPRGVQFSTQSASDAKSSPIPSFPRMEKDPGETSSDNEVVMSSPPKPPQEP